jgi:hypothetical protein
MLGLGLTLTRPIIRHSDAVDDPLAGISFALRLQTHNGNNVPLGLYQDTACAVPATMDGDPIAAWKGTLMGSPVTFTQADSQQQPLLFFQAGVPVVLGDGVDDILIGPLVTASLVFSMYAGLSAIDPNANGKFLCNGNSGGYYLSIADTNRNLLWENIANNYCGTATDQFETWSAVRPSSPASFWVDGVLNRSNITGTPSVPVSATTILDAIGNSVPSPAMLVALMISETAHDTTSRQLVESYIAALLP